MYNKNCTVIKIYWGSEIYKMYDEKWFTLSKDNLKKMTIAYCKIYELVDTKYKT